MIFLLAIVVVVAVYAAVFLYHQRRSSPE